MKQFLVFAVCLLLSSAVLAEEVCQNAVCKALSDDLLHHSINESVAPCDSFFDYVCSKWPASHPQPNNSRYGLNYFGLRQKLVNEEIDEAFLNALNSSNMVIRSVAQIHSDCLDQATIEKRGVTPLVEAIHRILGDWPLLQKAAPASKNGTKAAHWQDLYVNIFADTGLTPAFDLGTYYNFTTKKTIVNIQNGDTNNNRNTLFLDRHLAEYKAELQRLIKTFFAVPNDDRLKTDIEAIVHLEQKLATAYLDNFKQPSAKTMLTGTFADLSIALKGKADWQSMVNQILTKLSLSKVPARTPNDEVHVRALPYLVEAATILETVPISVVQNWFGLMMTIQLGPWTTDALQREIANFTGHHYDPAQRKAACNLLPRHYPDVQSRIYIDTHFSRKEKEEAEFLVKSLRIAFETDLQNHTEWLDASTKKAALEKLEAIKQTVGYEDWIVSDETLTSDYPHLNNETVKKGKFFESAVTFLADVRRTTLSNLNPQNVTFHRRSQVNDPTIVNAFYNRLTNSIIIPAGILQPPFFDDERPYSMNYGAIGSVMGHELTHAFDNHGAMYDKDGKLKNWWSPKTHELFNEKGKCFAEQYSALKEPLSGVMLNGNLTLGENIADNGGIKKAYAAYLEHQKALGKPSEVLPNLKLTADQLFFTAYAHVWCENVTPEEAKTTIRFSVHSPGRFRVNTVLGNTPAFAEAFKCPLGSKMNPAKKCSLW